MDHLLAIRLCGKHWWNRLFSSSLRGHSETSRNLYGDGLDIDCFKFADIACLRIRRIGCKLDFLIQD